MRCARGPADGVEKALGQLNMSFPVMCVFAIVQ